MNSLTETPLKEQLVEAGLKDGIRHQVIRDEGHGEYATRCGKRIAFRNLIVAQIPLSLINCDICKLGIDADFRAKNNQPTIGILHNGMSRLVDDIAERLQE